MRDERVASLLKEAVAGKQPRPGWDQRVLAEALAPRRRRWWLLALAPVPLVPLLAFYLHSQRQESDRPLIVAEQTRARAEAARAELQRQIARIEKEQAALEEQLARAKTEAERAAIQRKMQAHRARIKTLGEGPKIETGGDTADPLQGIK